MKLQTKTIILMLAIASLLLLTVFLSVRQAFYSNLVGVKWTGLYFSREEKIFDPAAKVKDMAAEARMKIYYEVDVDTIGYMRYQPNDNVSYRTVTYEIGIRADGAVVLREVDVEK